MKDMDKRTRNNFLIAVSVNILLLFLFFILFYFSGDIGNNEMMQSITSLREIESMQNNFSIYSTAIKETEKERELLDTFIIGKKDVAGFIEKLEQMAEHSGVSITKSVSVEKQTPQSKENLLKFSVRVRGSSSDVFYFLSLLENMPYKIRFRTLSMGMSDEGAGSDLLQVSSGAKNKLSSKSPVWAGETTFEVLSFINE